MSTIHAEALRKAFYETIRGTPEIARCAADVRNRLLDGGFYGLDFVNAAFQKWERDRDDISLVEAYGFAHVWTHLHMGDIAFCSVPLPSGPGPDRDIEFNQSILDQIPDGFQAKFVPARGRDADDDGLFTIKKDIGLWRMFRENEEDIREEPWFFGEDHTIALEVGTTSVSKTLQHLWCGKGVARWPYGYSKILVLAGVSTNLFSFTARARRKEGS